MQQRKIQRFDFGTLRDFRGPVTLETLRTTEQQHAAPPPPPAPTFSEAELEAARLAGKKEGYGEGFLAGQHDARAQADQRQREAEDVAQQLGQIMGDLSTTYQQLLTRESAALADLTLAIAQKVAGAALDARAAEVILALVEQCLPIVFSKPKLVIELSPAVFADTLDRIESLLRTHGAEAEIQFRPNDALSTSDVRIDWGTGQMARNTHDLWEEIRAILAQTPLTPTFPQPQHPHL